MGVAERIIEIMKQTANDCFCGQLLNMAGKCECGNCANYGCGMFSTEKGATA